MCRSTKYSIHCDATHYSTKVSDLHIMLPPINISSLRAKKKKTMKHMYCSETRNTCTMHIYT